MDVEKVTGSSNAAATWGKLLEDDALEDERKKAAVMGQEHVVGRGGKSDNANNESVDVLAIGFGRSAAT